MYFHLLVTGVAIAFALGRWSSTRTSKAAEASLALLVMVLYGQEALPCLPAEINPDSLQDWIDERGQTMDQFVRRNLRTQEQTDAFLEDAIEHLSSTGEEGSDGVLSVAEPFEDQVSLLSGE